MLIKFHIFVKEIIKLTNLNLSAILPKFPHDKLPPHVIYGKTRIFFVNFR